MRGLVETVASGIVMSCLAVAGCSGQTGLASETAMGTSTTGTTGLSTVADRPTDAGVTGTGDFESSSSTPASDMSTGRSEAETGSTMSCEEPDAVTSVWIHEEASLDRWSFLLDATCVVDQVEEAGLGFAVGLLCDEGGDTPTERSIRLTSAVAQPAPLLVGETVRAQLYRDFLAPTSSYARLSGPQGATLVAYYQWPLRVSVPRVVGTWFEVSVEMFGANCTPAEPEEGGGMFVVDPCPAIETRLGVNLTWGGTDLSLAPGDLTEEGGVVYAAAASQLDYVDMSCGPTPSARISMVRLRE